MKPPTQSAWKKCLCLQKPFAKGATRALVVTDMPFMSYHSDVGTAVQNAGEFIKIGAKGVKIEGCNDYILEVIKRCIGAGIPVMGHLGFTPQYLNTIGGYNVQGKSYDATLEILDKAKQLVKSGRFSQLCLKWFPKKAQNI